MLGVDREAVSDPQPVDALRRFIEETLDEPVLAALQVLLPRK